jgi:hypothetical protein
MPSPVLTFSELEAAAFGLFVAHYETEVPGLAKQLAHAVPSSRENTGGGFFTELVVDRKAARPVVTSSPLDGPQVRIAPMAWPLELLLFFKDGYLHLLEGYSVSGEGTSSVDLSGPFEFLIETLTARQQTFQVLRQVPGGDRVLAWYGARAGYHGHTEFADFEVVALNLRRGGASIVEIGLEGFPTFIFHFDDWLDVNLEGFSRQNVLGGLVLRPTEPRGVRDWELGVGYQDASVEMILEPCYGANGTIRGRLLRVEMIDPMQAGPVSS